MKKSRNSLSAARRRRITSPTSLLAAAAALSGIIPLDASTAEPAVRDSTLTLGSVTVTGRTSGPLPVRSVLSSVDILGEDLLRNQQVNNSWELFGRAPGVLLTPFKQGNVSGKFSFRAFNGEGELNAVKLLIDGIPSNANDGSMQFLDMISPLEIQRLEIVRGTNDARYGLHNIAGNANVVTRQGGNETLASVGIGSFNTREGQLAHGIEGDNWSQNYFIGYRESGNYRDHADSDKLTLSGKWFYTTDDSRFRAGLIARHYHNNADEPGYLTRADAHDHPRQSYALSSTDGGKRDMDALSAHLDVRLTDEVSWSAKAYGNELKDKRYIRFSASASQQERVTDETQYGALTSLSWRPKVTWAHEFSLEGGADLHREHNNSLRYLTAERAKQSQTRDQSFSFDTQGAYVQAVIAPIESLKVIPAYRIDDVEGSFTDRLTRRTSPINDFGLVKQPKVSVVYAPWQQGSVYGNWGRTFQVGAGSAAYKIPPRTADLKPSINEGWEAGVKLQPTDWIDGRLAVWEQKASDEVRRKLNDPAGDSENVGKTRRRGLDVQVNLRPEKRINAWFAYSAQRSKIIEPDPAAPTTRGKQIDHVPRHLLSGGVDVQALPELRLWASANGQSSYFLERTNSTGKFGSYLLLNLGVSYQLTRSISVDAQLKNVADRYTEYAWWDGAQSLHSPGDGRAFYLTLNWKLDR